MICVLVLATACSGGGANDRASTRSQLGIAEQFASAWVRQEFLSADRFLCRKGPGTAGVGLGFADARVTGSATPGPDPRSTVFVMDPPSDFHVPIAGVVHGKSTTGAVEVWMGGSEPPCVERYGVAVDDDVSSTPATE